MTPGSTVHQPAALAHAFLALGDGAPATPRRAVPPAAVVLLTAILLTMSTPLVWAGLVADAPETAATAPHRTVLVDGDDDGPAGP